MDFIATPTLELVTLLASLNDAKLKDCFIFAYSVASLGVCSVTVLDFAGGGVLAFAVGLLFLFFDRSGLCCFARRFAASNAHQAAYD